MEKGNFDSIFNSLNDRIKNPALFSILCVLIVRNWRLLIIIFNLNDYNNIECKIAAISNYFAIRNLYYEAGLNILYTLGLFVFSITVILCCEILLDSYYKFILKIWKKFVDKKQILIKEDIDLFNKEKHSLISENEELLNSNLKYRQQVIRLEEEYEKYKSNNKILNDEKILLTSQNIQLNQNLKGFKDIFSILTKEVKNQNEIIDSIFIKSKNNNEDVSLYISDKKIESDDSYLSSIVNKYFSILTDEEYENIFKLSDNISNLDETVLDSLIKDGIISYFHNKFYKGVMYYKFITESKRLNSDRFREMVEDLPF